MNVNAERTFNGMLSVYYIVFIVLTFFDRSWLWWVMIPLLASSLLYLVIMVLVKRLVRKYHQKKK